LKRLFGMRSGGSGGSEVLQKYASSSFCHILGIRRCSDDGVGGHSIG